MQMISQHKWYAKSIRNLFTISLLSWMFFSFLLLFPHEVQAASRVEKIGFPPNAVWTWSGKFTQAWLGPLENDAASGNHVNLHIQPLGGGNKGEEYSNYHITYNGIVKDEGGNDEYQWSISDSVTGRSTTISESTALAPEDAAAYATQEMSTFIEENATAVDAADLQALGTAIESDATTAEESPIVQSLLDLIAPVA